MSPTIFKKYACIIIGVKKYKHDIFGITIESVRHLILLY